VFYTSVKHSGSFSATWIPEESNEEPTDGDHDSTSATQLATDDSDKEGQGPDTNHQGGVYLDKLYFSDLDSGTEREEEYDTEEYGDTDIPAATPIQLNSGINPDARSSEK
jgi:hypothetical protein